MIHPVLSTRYEAEDPKKQQQQGQHFPFHDINFLPHAPHKRTLPPPEILSKSPPPGRSLVFAQSNMKSLSNLIFETKSNENVFDRDFIRKG